MSSSVEGVDLVPEFMAKGGIFVDVIRSSIRGRE